MASFGENKKSVPPCKRRNTKEMPPLIELASERTLHDLIPAALSGNDINTRDCLGRTPFHLVVKNKCSFETLNVLINARADINARDTFDKTPLLMALESACSLETLNVLINSGADVNARDIGGRTPLHLALESKCSLEGLNFLINARDWLGRTPFPLVVKKNCSLETLNVLINAGADINTRDDLEKTPLHLALENGCSLDTLNVLINAGADINARDKFGRTPLYLFLQSGTKRKRKEIELVLKELLRGHPELVENRDYYHKFPLDNVSNITSDVIFTTLKWVLLQNGGDFQWNRISEKPPEEAEMNFLQDCRSELELLRSFMVTHTLSLFDLVKACYVSPKFVNELRVKERFARVLQFEHNLTIYEEEVREIVRMVRVCRSLYGKTLPFPAFVKAGHLPNLSQKVLDYLSIEDLEKLSLAVNTY